MDFIIQLQDVKLRDFTYNYQSNTKYLYMLIPQF